MSRLQPHSSQATMSKSSLPLSLIISFRHNRCRVTTNLSQSHKQCQNTHFTLTALTKRRKRLIFRKCKIRCVRLLLFTRKLRIHCVLDFFPVTRLKHYVFFHTFLVLNGFILALKLSAVILAHRLLQSGISYLFLNSCAGTRISRHYKIKY